MYFQSSALTTPQLGKTFSREERCSWVVSTSEGREVQVACSVGSQEVFVWSSCVSVCGGRVDRQLALWRLSGSTSGPELATRPKGTSAVSSPSSSCCDPAAAVLQPSSRVKASRVHHTQIQIGAQHRSSQTISSRASLPLQPPPQEDARRLSYHTARLSPILGQLQNVRTYINDMWSIVLDLEQLTQH